MFLIIFSPKFKARLCALPPAVAEVSFFTPHLLAVRTQAGSDACGQKWFQFCCQGNWKVFENVYQANGEIFQWNKKKRKERKTPMVVSSLDCTHSCHTRGSWWVIPYFLFHVPGVYVPSNTGVVPGAGTGPGTGFFPGNNASNHPEELQITTYLNDMLYNNNNCIHFMKKYDLLHTVSLNYNRQTQNDGGRCYRDFPGVPRETKTMCF